MIAMTPGTESQNDASATDDVVARLHRLVESNGVRWRRLFLLELVGFAIAVPLAYLLLFLFLDSRLHLPTWARTLISLGFCAGVAWLVVQGVRRWRAIHLTEDSVALAMERRTTGGVQNRLINAVQLARESRSELVRAVVEDNYHRLEEMVLEHAGHTRPAILRIGIVALLIAGGAIFWLLQPAQFTNSAARLLLPFADVAPLYRTTLVVEPGNIEAVGDVTIHVTIHGERPETLTVLKSVGDKHSSEVVAVEPNATVATYTFHGLEQSINYAVRGGDFTSPFYRIEVPTPARLSLARVRYQYPEYTKLPDKQFESAGGDLEAVTGTHAHLAFVFDQPPDEAWLLLEHSAAAGQSGAHVERLPLAKGSGGEFQGEIVLEGLLGYQIETRQGTRPADRGLPYAIRIQADQPPKLDLTGFERTTEAQVDSVLAVEISATDDFGLDKVGLFWRRLLPGETKPANDAEGWQPVKVWPAEGKTAFKQSFELSLAALDVAEGEHLEIVLRGSDNDPRKKGDWTNGAPFSMVVGGEGSALQLEYESIARTDGELKALLQTERQLTGQAAEWHKKMDGSSGLKWDDPKQVAQLLEAVKSQQTEQEKLRETASRVARQIVAQAGNLRFSVGMLADTEMVRAGRILASIPTRDELTAKRSALADARLTEERTARSLQEIVDQYANFRVEWELNHMIPFAKMLSERQTALRDLSRASAKQPTSRAAELVRTSVARRQAKVAELCQLIQPAFARLSEHLKSQEPAVAQAFAAGGVTLASGELTTPMKQSAEAAQKGNWTDAATQQTIAADLLAKMYHQLHEAQSAAAREALAALEDKMKSDAEAQKAIEKLKQGLPGNFLTNVPENLKLKDVLTMREVAQNKNAGITKDPAAENYVFPESAKGMLQASDTGKRQEFKNLQLADTPSGTPSFPNSSDRTPNKVSPFIQEKFEDLIGKLLEEADAMQEKYETYNLNAAFNINEPGNVSKQGGDINSTAAAAATGNMKPPTSNVGGATRTGRQGARAHGMTVGDESVNRRGRDKAQEGQEKVGDQAGLMKERMSDDPQKDTSTGVGGKKVDSDDTKFSTKDSGKWTDDIAKRLGAPQKKNSIVERQDGRLDPRVGEMLRDLESKQEQLIERVKIIKKELNNLYLPTDHLDEIMAGLNANLEGLKQRPDSDLFRLQVQTLDKLRNSIRVFRSANAGFQPSLPREQAVKGRVLDEPARQTIPGYEDAVKRYYEKLSSR